MKRLPIALAALVFAAAASAQQISGPMQPLSLRAYPPSSGFEYSGLRVDERRNSQRPCIGAGEVAQTLNTRFGIIGASASVTRGLAAQGQLYRLVL